MGIYQFSIRKDKKIQKKKLKKKLQGLKSSLSMLTSCMTAIVVQAQIAVYRDLFELLTDLRMDEQILLYASEYNCSDLKSP